MYVLILYSYMLYEILNESDLMWTGLTQIVDIDKGEIELSSATGTQWHCVLLARLVSVD